MAKRINKEQKNQNEKQLQIMWHSCSHVLAQAVMQMFPEAKLGIGPAIEDGFYYDFDLPRSLIPEDLQIIEKKMKKIIKENYQFKKEIVDRKKAIEFMKKIRQFYKVELLKEMKDKKVTVFRQGDFVDLCAGPHLDSTGEIGPFKLLSIAGAYWKGNEKNPMLQRIYATCFETKKQLNDYLKKLEEVEKRDHRKLGRKLDLFSLPEEIGGGLPIWHTKGAILREIIEDFWKKEHKKRGYQLVYTPHIANLDIWKKSGHWKFYKEYLYSPIKIDKSEYLLKPMNCPFHILIYKSKLRSYRDLPIRYAELGTVYRYERSGVLHGLVRVRGFTQDDAHIFCREDQLEDEIIEVIKLAQFMITTFGFKNYKIYLSTRPKKSIGTDKMWNLATKALKNALEKAKLSYKIDPGEGVFYGPKIDIKLEDALGRQWQGPTIQVDFNFPEKFNVNYIDQKGKKQQVVMVHRTVLGSIERFIGCLIEHYEGAFPLWLAPSQVIIIPLSDKFLKYAQEVNHQLSNVNCRSEIDNRCESVSKKIREAEIQKIPYMLVVGEKEVATAKTQKDIKNAEVSVRSLGKNKLESIKIDKFIDKILKEIKEKK
jgi:threonyl-tRNA synthetase